MHDSLPQIIFYVFSGLTLLSALMVITQNNPVRCVLFLVLAFLWILVHAEFLALILVLVYVGAVMTLFLFVVMMLNIDVESMNKHYLRYLLIGLPFVAFLTALLFMALPTGAYKTEIFATALPSSALSNTEALGMILYTDYVWGFELAAVILLTAIVAAITLVHRNRVRSKRQSILRQIMTQPSDRLRVLKMEAEK